MALDVFKMAAYEKGGGQFLIFVDQLNDGRKHGVQVDYYVGTDSVGDESYFKDAGLWSAKSVAKLAAYGTPRFEHQPTPEWLFVESLRWYMRHLVQDQPPHWADILVGIINDLDLQGIIRQ